MRFAIVLLAKLLVASIWVGLPVLLVVLTRPHEAWPWLGALIAAPMIRYSLLSDEGLCARVIRLPIFRSRDRAGKLGR